jgi:hypothetical protein
MNYYISESICDNLEIDVVDQFDEPLTNYIKSNIRFDTAEFDGFVVVLQFSIEKEMGYRFGKDRLQVSKKERLIFLGVNLANEQFEQGNQQTQLNYIISRIEQVKNENLSKLIKLGLIQ